METITIIIVTIGVIVLVGLISKFFLKKSSSDASANAGSPERKLQGTLRARARVEEARDKNYQRLKELEEKAAMAAEGGAGGAQEAETLKAIVGCIGEISKQESSINNLINDYNNIEVGSFRQRSFEVQRGGSPRAMWDYLLFLENDNAKTRDAIFTLSDAIADAEGESGSGSNSGNTSSSRAFNRGVIKSALLTRRVSYRDRCINVESEIDALLKAMLNPILRRRDAAADGELVEEAGKALEEMREREEALVGPLVAAGKEFSAKFAIERKMKFGRLCGVFGAAGDYLRNGGENRGGEGNQESDIVEILAPLSKAIIPSMVDNEYKELIEK